MGKDEKCLTLLNKKETDSSASSWNTLNKNGVHVKRVPFSGAADGFKGDVIVTLKQKDYKLECKNRKDFKTLYSWLENTDALMLKGDRKEMLLVMPLNNALKLVSEIGGVTYG